MSKKIELTSEEVDKCLKMYNEDLLGSTAISKKMDIHKTIIIRTLKENGVVFGSSGRRNIGGKSAADKRYYEKNKDTIKEYYKEWAIDNYDNLKSYHKKWRTDNQGYSDKRTAYEREKRRNNPTYRLICNTRTALWTCLKEANINKNKSTFDLLGYTVQELINHLEKQFTDGMSWDNYGEWHVDHIIPIKSFNFKSASDYDFFKCWSLENLRPMWATTREVNGKLYEGNLNKGDKVSTTCYQYRIREKKKIEEIGLLPFDVSDVSIKNSIVRVIDKNTTKKIIEEYEWLGYIPSYTKYHFGIFFIVNGVEYLGGVLSFQKDYVENVGGWDKYGYTNKILLLSRGVSIWWTPKNTASYLIAKALKWIEQNTQYKVITATIDELAGEIGTIYQSCNWVYVGVMNGNILKNGTERERLGTIINGKLYTSRQIRSMLGTMKKSVILEHYPDAKFVKQKAKKRYFYFLGNKNERKNNLLMIKDQIKPYPKR